MKIFNGLSEGFSPHNKTYDGAYCAAVYILIISIKYYFIASIALLVMFSIRIRVKWSLKILKFDRK